ncbi:MAG: hypothetical protein IKX68_07920 [Clostridiales bacterium]|nr:hypothetical protein [Clostridiales bacterium]
MQIDSQENRIMWYCAMLALTGQSVALLLLCNPFIAATFFAGSLILLNLSCFLSGTPKKCFSALLILLEIAAVILLPRWFMGALSLPAVSIAIINYKKILRVTCFVLSFGAAMLHIVKLRPDVVSALLYIGFSVAAFVFWLIVLYLYSNTVATQAKLNQALTAAAVEALEQRSLREEIAKNQKINENNARLEERERISRDIHNYVGHTLSAATVTLDAATLLVPSDQDKALEKIDAANSRVHEAISSVRSVVRTLDAEDDCIETADYLLSLEKMVDEFKTDTAIKIYHNFKQEHPDARIPIQTASFISSSLSELLTNGVKHGNADLFVITFVLDTGHIRLRVQDNGTGWGDISLNEKKLRLANGFGLRKIRDYTESCGGSFDIDSVDGFTVDLSLPFEGGNT